MKLSNEIISSIARTYQYISRIDIQADYFEEINNRDTEHLKFTKSGKLSESNEKVCRQYVAEEYQEAFFKFVDLKTLPERMKNEETLVLEYRMKDGDWHRLRFVEKKRDENGVLTHVLCLIRSISDTKKWEHELMYQVEEARKAAALKARFLSNMSHDIRTPMNAIIGMTCVARQECQDETICGYLDKIKSSSEFLLGLINDMLDISRIESGNLNLKSEQMSREMFGTAINTTIGPLMEQKNITFQCDLQHMEEMIYTDAVRFKQIFFNLLSNAAKYTPEGGNVWLLTERLRTEGNDEWVRFTVRDSGIGMSEEFLEHAFEPFSQEGNRTLALQWQGTGLGLAIVKKLVVMMHGTIEIHSKLGEGTEVILDLPLTISGVDAPEKMPQAVMAKQNLEGRRVLLAEDNEINTFVARRILESKGILVEHAENGKRAVELVEQNPEGYFDAIVMDIRMPVMSGLEAARQIRAMSRTDAQTVPIIAMTANDWLTSSS